MLLYLLLCSRVFWRREVADLESFLIPAIIRPTASRKLAVGFFFYGTNWKLHKRQRHSESSD